MASGSQNMTSDKARLLSTNPGTTKFWRGDNTWSNILTGQLYINIGEDVGLNQAGSLIIGTKGGTNLGIDDNEIMARNNSAASTLYIQNEGGAVVIGANTTINANMTHNGIDYFANGTTYYINNSAAGYLNYLHLARTSDHGLQVGAIRGKAYNNGTNQTGEYIHMYDRVHIGSPHGWGSRNAPSNGLSTYGGCDLATDTGQVRITDGHSRGVDNTAFKNRLVIGTNESNESSGEALTAANASWGIGFQRTWATSNHGTDSEAGIYAVGSAGWRTGLAFRVKNTSTQGATHDTTAIWISPAGRVGIKNTSPDSSNLTVGSRETTSGPSSLTTTHRITIVPHFHTGGPWRFTSRDDSSNAYLSIYYGDTELIRMKHDGTQMIDWKGNVTGKARYVEADNNAQGPGGALCRSGAGRADNSSTGDTWIFWDTIGGTASPWGFRHAQGENKIEFIGAGTIGAYITLNTGASKFGTITSGAITSSGTIKSTFDGPAFLAQTGSGSWSYLRIHNGSNLWDIASNSNSNSGALEFRVGGADAGPFITTGGAMVWRSSAAAPGTSTHMAISYGRMQSWGSLYINADTDGSQSEYIILTAGRGISSSMSDGAYVGYSEVGSYLSTRIRNTLHVHPAAGAWTEGIRIHAASNGWTTLILCGTDMTGDSNTSANSWSFHQYSGNFYLAKNGSSSGTTWLECVSNTWAFRTNNAVKFLTTGGGAQNIMVNAIGCGPDYSQFSLGSYRLHVNGSGYMSGTLIVDQLDTLSTGGEHHILCNASGNGNVYLFNNSSNKGIYSSNAGAVIMMWGANSGTPYFYGYLQNPSSRLVKENIHTISETEAYKILQLNPVTFNFKKYWSDNNKIQVGLIAEDVELIYPNLVHIPPNYDEDKVINWDGKSEKPSIKNLDYDKFVPYLIKLAQMQQRAIDQLRNELNSLKLNI